MSEDKFMDEDNCEDEVGDKSESCPQTLPTAKKLSPNMSSDRYGQGLVCGHV